MNASNPSRARLTIFGLMLQVVAAALVAMGCLWIRDAIAAADPSNNMGDQQVQDLEVLGCLLPAMASFAVAGVASARGMRGRGDEIAPALARWRKPALIGVWPAFLIVPSFPMPGLVKFAIDPVISFAVAFFWTWTRPSDARPWWRGLVNFFYFPIIFAERHSPE